MWEFFVLSLQHFYRFETLYIFEKESGGRSERWWKRPLEKRRQGESRGSGRGNRGWVSEDSETMWGAERSQPSYLIRGGASLLDLRDYFRVKTLEYHQKMTDDWRTAPRHMWEPLMGKPLSEGRCRVLLGHPTCSLLLTQISQGSADTAWWARSAKNRWSWNLTDQETDRPKATAVALAEKPTLSPLPTCLLPRDGESRLRAETGR